MREPALVTIVFGYLPAARLCALLRNSSVWMLESDENSKEVIAASKAIDLETLSGSISYSRREANQDLADWLRGTLDEIDDHHDGYLWTQWSRIDVIGLEFTLALEEVARDFGGVLPNEGGFTITSVESDG